MLQPLERGKTPDLVSAKDDVIVENIKREKPGSAAKEVGGFSVSSIEAQNFANHCKLEQSGNCWFVRR
jgi:hypothetical protein